jgi:hypothetical protein
MMFEKMRGYSKDVNDPNRLFEIKMDIKKTRHEMYDRCFNSVFKPLVKLFRDDFFLKR